MSSCDSKRQSERIRPVPITAVDLNERISLLYSPHLQQFICLSIEMLSRLRLCSGFKTLDGHLRSMVERVKCNPRRSLETLLKCGLMMSEGEVRRLVFDQMQDDTHGPKITYLTIPTCDRVDELRKAVRSFASHIADTGRHIRILIADDGLQHGSSYDVASIVRGHKMIPEDLVEYHSLSAKQQFLASLCHGTEIPEGVVEFAIFGAGFKGPRFGANRNYILLRTAGDMFLTVDDDSLCQVAVAPGSQDDGIAVYGARAKPEMWFFRDIEEATGSIPNRPIDIFRAHEELLGRSLTDSINQSLKSGEMSNDLEVDDVCDHFINDVARGRGKIRITSNGVVGDSGMYSGAGILLHEAEATRERLLKSELTLEGALASRIVARQSLRRGISHNGPLCTMFMGVDNRTILPPFFPLCRGEDTIFGSCMTLCVPDAYIGHLPFCLSHIPTKRRAYSSDLWSKTRVCNAIIAILELVGCEMGVVHSEMRMKVLGDRLTAFGSLSLAEFSIELKHALRRVASRLLSEHTELLRRFDGAPAFWVKRVAFEDQKLRRSLYEDDYHLPIDLPFYDDQRNCLTILQRLVLKFGELVWWWPEIYHRARFLRGC